MHEFSLYGQVPHKQHGRVLQQLVGVTCMQPKPVREIHLVFKARTPSALQSDFPGGNNSSDKQQETRRLMTILNSGIYYMQVVGYVQPDPPSTANGGSLGDDVEMTNGSHSATKSRHIEWQVDFKDTPDAGKQAVSSRYTIRATIEDGNFMEFMYQFGYDYVSRYMVVGHKSYDQDTTLFLHRVKQVPEAATPDAVMDFSFLDEHGAPSPLDGHDGYLLQVSIDALEGNNQEVKDRATSQLLAMKEVLKQAVILTPGDRLALDTKIPISTRRT